MDLGLKGKSALITGASRGIGFACAKAFAEEGCDVRMVALDLQRLESAAEIIAGIGGGTVTTHVADMAQTDDLLGMIDRFSDSDILVNNGGGIPAGTLDEIDGPAWRAGWNSKVFGYIDATRAMLEHMYVRGSGVIVNVIGMGAVMHMYNYAAGSSGNSALMAFTEAVGSRSIDRGVRVVGVNPGAIDTDRYQGIRVISADMPLGRAGTPSEVGDVVAFLASDRATYISGTVISIDGGRVHRSAPESHK
jgi:3-oxoacyl-[acyl-carrier protein] reductase